jgi:exopolysaccharide biosynthesis polyprenyl glycosylphosphotransferase
MTAAPTTLQTAFDKQYFHLPQMVPIRRKLFLIFDLLCLIAAFLASRELASFLARQFSYGGHLYGSWIEFFAPAASNGTFPELSELRWVWWVFFLVTPVTVLCVDILGGHASIREQRPLRIVLSGIVASVAGIALPSTLFFLLKTPGFSRILIVSFFVTNCIAIIVPRLVGRSWSEFIRRERVYSEEVAIVGHHTAAISVADRFSKVLSPLDFQLVGYFSPERCATGLTLKDGEEVPLLGHIDDLEQVLVHHAIQRLVIILPEDGVGWLEGALKMCDYFRVTTHIVPQAVLTTELTDLVADENSAPGSIPCLTLAPPELQSDWLYVKRLLDVSVSAVLLLLLSPLFLLIAIIIKLTTPQLPVFYPWRVVGNRGRRFTGYKFTTMVADVDPRRSELELTALNEMSGPVFKIAKDPRITPLGRFLRKYSLNELPQLWSVLKGDMSLVGPRPAGQHELGQYEPWHKRKLSAQPGITCFWQVRGRNRISNFDDWVRLDLEYIQTRSLWVDCKILALTAWVVIRGTGT